MIALSFRASNCSTFVNEYSGDAEELLTIFLLKNVECIPISRNQKVLVMSSIEQFVAYIAHDRADKKWIYNQ